MVALTFSFLPLIAAPFLYRWCSHRRSLMAFMDGFIFVAVGGLLLVGVLPSAFQHGGWGVFPFLAAGIIPKRTMSTGRTRKSTTCCGSHRNWIRRRSLTTPTCCIKTWTGSAT